MSGSLEMLRSSRDFGAISSDSRSRADSLLLVRFRQNELGRTRYGISTGRRLGSAVVRNRIRRRLRSLLRQLDPAIGAGWDILLVARPPAAAASHLELGDSLRRLLRSSGLMEGRESAT